MTPGELKALLKQHGIDAKIENIRSPFIKGHYVHHSVSGLTNAEAEARKAKIWELGGSSVSRIVDNGLTREQYMDAKKQLFPDEIEKKELSKSERLKWLDRYPVSTQEDLEDLERGAAVNEFGKKMTRNEAESAAYKDWLTGQHTKAAAFHHVAGGMARASANQEAAKKHANMYRMHIEKLGHSAYDAPPDSVRAHMDKDPGDHYDFKNHPGDDFLANGDKK